MRAGLKKTTHTHKKRQPPATQTKSKAPAKPVVLARGVGG